MQLNKRENGIFIIFLKNMILHVCTCPKLIISFPNKVVNGILPHASSREPIRLSIIEISCGEYITDVYTMVEECLSENSCSKQFKSGTFKLLLEFVLLNMNFSHHYTCTLCHLIFVVINSCLLCWFMCIHCSIGSCECCRGTFEKINHDQNVVQSLKSLFTYRVG